MTFYEQELRKLFADGTVIGSPKFTGRPVWERWERISVPVCSL